MRFDRASWTSHGSTALFVLLWSSGGILSKIGLEHASAFVFLILRFALAGLALLGFALLSRRDWLPTPGTRGLAAGVGLLLVGGYSACYFLALEHGVTPGLLATVLGVQPILTLILLERRLLGPRILGLCLALAGLVLVMYDSLMLTRFSGAGMLFAVGALISVTAGTLLQKRIRQSPAQVLPLQYLVSLSICVALLPSQPVVLEYTVGLLLAVLWLGLVISVAAQLLLYRLISRGNLVNVTSLFYLVPVVTALLDYLLLGNRLPTLSVAGMLAILGGLALVLRRS